MADHLHEFSVIQTDLKTKNIKHPPPSSSSFRCLNSLLARWQLVDSYSSFIAAIVCNLREDVESCDVESVSSAFIGKVSWGSTYSKDLRTSEHADDITTGGRGIKAGTIGFGIAGAAGISSLLPTLGSFVPHGRSISG